MWRILTYVIFGWMMLTRSCCRTLVLADAAKRLEHAVHMMCATPPGHGERIVQKRRAIASLVLNKGKARATCSEKSGVQEENEDIEEIMEALRGGVGAWHKMQQGTA